jgi:hypothetical protein
VLGGVGVVVVVVVVVLDDVGGGFVPITGGCVEGEVGGGAGGIGTTSPGAWLASGFRLGGALSPKGTGAFGPLSTYTGVPGLSAA